VTFLLDVNLVMALRWENHEHHQRAHRWFSAATAFATCPVVQLGFVRVSSHPLLGYAFSAEQAFSVLRHFLGDARHRFVPDDVSCTDRVFLTERISSPNHVTDHYLVTLARQHGLVLATFDGALSRAFPDEPELVKLIS